MGHLGCHLGHVMSRPMWLPRAMSGSMTLLQVGSVFISVACVITESRIY